MLFCLTIHVTLNDLLIYILFLLSKIVEYNGNIWSASRDLSVKQWNADSGVCVNTIPDTHELNIAAIGVHSSGLEIATGSRDYSVKIWDVATSKCKNNFTASRNVVTSLMYASSTSTSSISNANLLYQGSEDLSVRGWDARSSEGKPVLHMKDYVYFPTCISTLPSDCNYLTTGCKGFNGSGCEVKVWDIRKTNKATLVFNGHTHDVNDCIYLNQSNSANDMESYSPELLPCILSCSKDGSIAVWDTLTNTKVAWLSGCSRHFTSIMLIPTTSECAGDVGTVHFMVGAYDGSLSYCTLSPSLGIDSSMDAEYKYIITVVHSTPPYEYRGN